MTIIIPPAEPGEYGCYHRPFKRFLKKRGAEILAPKNGIILRFKTRRGHGVVEHAQDLLWWSRDAENAWAAFLKDGPQSSWRAYPYPDPIPHEKKADTVKTLVERDGPRCIYCWAALSIDEITIEHFVPRNVGGGNHLNNLGLSCISCNQAAGSLSVSEKISLAIRGSFT